MEGWSFVSNEQAAHTSRPASMISVFRSQIQQSKVYFSTWAYWLVTQWLRTALLFSESSAGQEPEIGSSESKHKPSLT